MTSFYTTRTGLNFHNSTREKFGTFYSNCSNKTVPLPLLPAFQRNAINLSNSKTKDRLINLKKELNLKQIQMKELKLAYVKLENEKENNQKLLDNVIIENKNANTLKKSHSNKEFSISKESYDKLKEVTDVSVLKRKIATIQKMIREKDAQIKELSLDSKVSKLHEKNLSLEEVNTNLASLTRKYEEIKKVIEETEPKTKEETQNKDYYKALFLTLKSDNDRLKEKFDELKSNQQSHVSKIASLEEKGSAIKFQIKSLKQQEKEKDKEILFYKECIDQINSFSKEKEENKEMSNHAVDGIKVLKKEINEKDDKIAELQTIKFDLFGQVKEKEKKEKKLQSLDSNTIRNIRKDTETMDREIFSIKEENNKLRNEIEKKENEYKKRREDFLNILRKKAEDYDYEREDFEYLSEIKKEEPASDHEST